MIMTGFAGEGPVRREHAMINDGNDGDGEMSKATESLDLAKDAVNSARAKVDEVGRHFGDAVERARRPETYVDILKKATRAALIAMVIAAFVAGALFTAGRRR